MELHNLKYASGSRKKRKRIGRGEGSGHGGTATRGENGQLSRSGSKHRMWFEGGQMPLQRRVPKVGFKSPFKTVFQVVNVADLQKLVDDSKLTDQKVDSAFLYKCGLIRSGIKPFKVLGQGEIKAKVTIEANSFSNSAKEKIEAVGGITSIIK